jgi:hypothetical protein
MWDLCSPGKKSEVVHTCAENAGTSTGSMSAADVSELAHIAKADGLRVAMRPTIRVGPPQDWNNAKISWEGHINPPNERRWFESLLSAEMPYLRAARQVHVSQFVVTTELKSLQYSLAWPWFLSRAHEACGCDVSYSAQMQEYEQRQPSLPPVQNIGTDFYPVLSFPSSASQTQVTAAWKASLAKIPAARLARTSFDELSIRATAGAYQHPANWNAPGALAPQVQARGTSPVPARRPRIITWRRSTSTLCRSTTTPPRPFTFPAYFVHNAGSRALRGCRAILARA